MSSPLNPLFSEHWYRVKFMKPRLRAHIKLQRHDYRDQIWYVLEDKTSARFHRFNAPAYQVIGLMNGQRTVNQIWEEVNTILGDNAPVQDEIIQLLGQLHHADALQTDTTPDVEDLMRRGQRYEQQKRIGRFKNPLSFRLPLFDPDRFLDITLPWVRVLYSRWFLLLWISLVFVGVLMAGAHWQELLSSASPQMLTPSNLFLLWLLYPIIKLCHELGHAYAAKLEGGEVHEMGIIFLVFMPIPYVDASAATAFSSKYKRMLVGAAGVMVEMLLAVLALFLWLAIEPGVIRSACFNILLIGGVSTVLFNGNPLLRFDGYYVLADAIGIPNLAQRSNKYLAYLVQHTVFGMDEARSPVTSPGEAAWFVFYAIASFCYRVGILALICLFLIDTLFIVGVVLATWAVLNQIVFPVAKQVNFVFFDPALRRRRFRAAFVTGFFVVAMVGVATAVPVNSLTRFEGVVWPPDDSNLVAGADGFIVELLAQPGAVVSLGQPLIQLENNLYQGEMAAKLAKLKELNARFTAARVSNRVQAKLVQDEILGLQAEVDKLQKKIDSLRITSPGDGLFQVPGEGNLLGQFIRQGQLLAYVIQADKATARVVVTQADLNRVRQRLERIELRLASRMGQVLEGTLLREVPQASHRLPSKVLSIEGGGPFAPDPQGRSPLSTRERLFEFEIELPLAIEEAKIGTRVYVRFDHGSETLSRQWYRRFRQLFLSRLNA